MIMIGFKFFLTYGQCNFWFWKITCVQNAENQAIGAGSLDDIGNC